MKEKNKIFKQVFEWLYLNGKAIDQADIARQTGISKTTISRIMNHGVGHPDEKTIRKFNAAYDNMFNPDFLRGKSDKMFMDEVNSVTSQPSSGIPDYGSMTNAIIAAKDDAIESLKRELLKTEESAKREIDAKEKTIDALRGRLVEKEARIVDKQAMIDNLQEQLVDLKRQLSACRSKEMLGEYPFKIGAAEEGDLPSAKK